MRYEMTHAKDYTTYKAAAEALDRDFGLDAFKSEVKGFRLAAAERPPDREIDVSAWVRERGCLCCGLVGRLSRAG